MTHIEVTKETFYTLFNDEGMTEKTDLYEKTNYYNSKIDQRGYKLYNFVSSKKHQYYLTDINL